MRISPIAELLGWSDRPLLEPAHGATGEEIYAIDQSRAQQEMRDFQDNVLLSFLYWRSALGVVRRELNWRGRRRLRHGVNANLLSVWRGLMVY